MTAAIHHVHATHLTYALHAALKATRCGPSIMYGASFKLKTLPRSHSQ